MDKVLTTWYISVMMYRHHIRGTVLREKKGLWWSYIHNKKLIRIFVAKNIKKLQALEHQWECND